MLATRDVVDRATDRLNPPRFRAICTVAYRSPPAQDCLTSRRALVRAQYRPAKKCLQTGDFGIAPNSCSRRGNRQGKCKCLVGIRMDASEPRPSPPVRHAIVCIGSTGPGRAHARLRPERAELLWGSPVWGELEQRGATVAVVRYPAAPDSAEPQRRSRSPELSTTSSSLASVGARATSSPMRSRRRCARTPSHFTSSAQPASVGAGPELASIGAMKRGSSSSAASDTHGRVRRPSSLERSIMLIRSRRCLLSSPRGLDP
jgi:hypothetical protein